MSEHSHPIGDLQSSGLMWAINAYIMHPQGFELVSEENQLKIRGDGSTVRSYVTVDPAKVDGAWRQFRQTLLDATVANKRPGPNHVPGAGIPSAVVPLPRTES